MSDNPTTVSTVLNPSRQEVRNIVGQALQDAEDPSQCFADMLMATCQIGHMAGVDMANVQPMVNSAMPNAIIAGDYVLNKVGEENVG